MENSAELNGKFLGTISSDFVKIFEKLKDAAYHIKSQGFSDCPIFIFCKEEQPIGQLLFKKVEMDIDWNVYMSYVEEFEQRQLVTEVDKFKSTYKNIDEFCTLFVLDPEFTNFVSLPYPED